MRKILFALTLSALPAYARAAPVGTPAIITGIVLPAPQQPEDARETLEAARAFYDFWNTGDRSLLRRAIAPGFVDHTPPPGRVAGPEGPALAAREFLKAIPDLQVTVTRMVLSGPYVTVHMHFDGHFTGSMGGHLGRGQTIHFIATDLLRVTRGRITDNWHLEDNLALQTEMGLIQHVP
ncbi:ester cyclase [Asaia sp. VD9]|uniref:ester cyclase n=1 Tax=Asaia sp. VD9 TaxID=3081235 RepID=UPI00301868DF